MSNFLLLKVKFVIIFMIIISCSTCISSGLEIGVSPSSLTINSRINEIVCNKLTLMSSINNVNINIIDYWSKTSGKYLDNYFLNSENLSLYLDYPKQVKLNKNQEIILCMKGEKKGNFHGILIFETLDEKINIGIWMNVNINSINEIKGNTYLDYEETNARGLKGNLMNFFLIINSLLIAFLGYFVIIGLKKDQVINE
jgi:hypothetical protein